MIRKADKKDIPAIQALAGIAFRETYRTILSPGQMEYMMEMMYSEESLARQMGEERNVFFLEDGKGYVSYRPDGRTEDGRPRFHLEKLYVLPDFQKTGLGKRLFDTVVQAVRGATIRQQPAEEHIQQDRPSSGDLARQDLQPAEEHIQQDRPSAGEQAPRHQRQDQAPADQAPGARIELNVNRNNPALGFYEHIGMRKDREGDFPIGNGYYMNDYIMALDL